MPSLYRRDVKKATPFVFLPEPLKTAITAA